MALKKVLQRVETLKKQKSKTIRDRLQAERMRFELKAQKLRALEDARKKEMNVILDVKFELADLQKKLRQLQASNERVKKVRVHNLLLSQHVHKRVFLSHRNPK